MVSVMYVLDAIMYVLDAIMYVLDVFFLTTALSLNLGSTVSVTWFTRRVLVETWTSGGGAQRKHPCL
jgi:hypothetical protein